MRWKKNKIIPKLGDRRVIKKFIWWPLCLDGETRWLETAEIIQEVKILNGIDRDKYSWVSVHWIYSAMTKWEPIKYDEYDWNLPTIMSMPNKLKNDFPNEDTQ